MPEVKFTANVDTSSFNKAGEQSRQAFENKFNKSGKPFKPRVDSRPLGKISSDLTEFDKSLSASNARVIAFGASASIIFGVQRALVSVVEQFRNVEKSIKEIDVVLNAGQSNLENFTNQLFEIGKKTSQSFATVSEAAIEFSRQGLGVNDTLKQTEAALALVRIGGINAADAVQSLTAVMNTFRDSSVSAIDVVSKIAKLDVSFAVSPEDLIEGLRRVGAAASDAGVGLDQLGAIITSVQQKTARGGSVIGNGLKTIFTRLQRSTTLDQLEDLGIQVRDTEGNVLPLIDRLKNLATVYYTLGEAQQNQVAQLSAGVFQINTFKAILSDLNDEFGVYDRALKVANGANGEAEKRVAELAQTYDALVISVAESTRQLAATLGKNIFEPVLRDLLDAFSSTFNGISDILSGDGLGAQIGEGLLNGISSILSGPALVIIGKALLKLGGFIARDIGGALNSFIGLGSQQKRIVDLLNQGNGELAQQISATDSLIKRQEILNKAIAAEAAERRKIANISKGLVLSTRDIKRVARPGHSAGGVPHIASGFVPNLANAGDTQLAALREKIQIDRGVGGAKSTAKPVETLIDLGKGKQRAIVNTDEAIVRNFMGSGVDAVFTRDMIREAGGKSNLKPLGKKVQTFADGRIQNIPNFAEGESSGFDSLKRGLEQDLQKLSSVYKKARASYEKAKTDLEKAKKTGVFKKEAQELEKQRKSFDRLSKKYASFKTNVQEVIKKGPSGKEPIVPQENIGSPGKKRTDFLKASLRPTDTTFNKEFERNEINKKTEKKKQKVIEEEKKDISETQKKVKEVAKEKVEALEKEKKVTEATAKKVAKKVPVKKVATAKKRAAAKKAPAKKRVAAKISTRRKRGFALIKERELLEADQPKVEIDKSTKIKVEEIDIPKAEIDTPNAEVEIPKAKIDVPKAKVDASDANIIPKRGEVDIPKEQTEKATAKKITSKKRDEELLKKIDRNNKQKEIERLKRPVISAKSILEEEFDLETPLSKRKEGRFRVKGSLPVEGSEGDSKEVISDLEKLEKDRAKNQNKSFNRFQGSLATVGDALGGQLDKVRSQTKPRSQEGQARDETLRETRKAEIEKKKAEEKKAREINRLQGEAIKENQDFDKARQKEAKRGDTVNRRRQRRIAETQVRAIEENEKFDRKRAKERSKIEKIQEFAIEENTAFDDRKKREKEAKIRPLLKEREEENLRSGRFAPTREETSFSLKKQERAKESRRLRKIDIEAEKTVAKERLRILKENAPKPGARREDFERSLEILDKKNRDLLEQPPSGEVPPKLPVDRADAVTRKIEKQFTGARGLIPSFSSFNKRFDKSLDKLGGREVLGPNEVKALRSRVETKRTQSRQNLLFSSSFAFPLIAEQINSAFAANATTPEGRDTQEVASSAISGVSTALSLVATLGPVLGGSLGVLTTAFQTSSAFVKNFGVSLRQLRESFDKTRAANTRVVESANAYSASQARLVSLSNAPGGGDPRERSLALLESSRKIVELENSAKDAGLTPEAIKSLITSVTGGDATERDVAIQEFQQAAKITENSLAANAELRAAQDKFFSGFAGFFRGIPTLFGGERDFEFSGSDQVKLIAQTLGETVDERTLTKRQVDRLSSGEVDNFDELEALGLKLTDNTKLLISESGESAESLAKFTANVIATRAETLELAAAQQRAVVATNNTAAALRRITELGSKLQSSVNFSANTLNEISNNRVSNFLKDETFSEEVRGQVAFEQRLLEIDSDLNNALNNVDLLKGVEPAIEKLSQRDKNLGRTLLKSIETRNDPLGNRELLQQLTQDEELRKSNEEIQTEVQQLKAKAEQQRILAKDNNNFLKANLKTSKLAKIFGGDVGKIDVDKLAKVISEGLAATRNEEDPTRVRRNAFSLGNARANLSVRKEQAVEREQRQEAIQAARTRQVAFRELIDQGILPSQNILKDLPEDIKNTAGRVIQVFSDRATKDRRLETEDTVDRGIIQPAIDQLRLLFEDGLGGKTAKPTQQRLDRFEEQVQSGNIDEAFNIVRELRKGLSGVDRFDGRFNESLFNELLSSIQAGQDLKDSSGAIAAAQISKLIAREDIPENTLKALEAIKGNNEAQAAALGSIAKGTGISLTGQSVMIKRLELQNNTTDDILAEIKRSNQLLALRQQEEETVETLNDVATEIGVLKASRRGLNESSISRDSILKSPEFEFFKKGTNVVVGGDEIFKTVSSAIGNLNFNGEDIVNILEEVSKQLKGGPKAPALIELIKASKIQSAREIGIPKEFQGPPKKIAQEIARSLGKERSEAIRGKSEFQDLSSQGVSSDNIRNIGKIINDSSLTLSQVQAKLSGLISNVSPQEQSAIDKLIKSLDSPELRAKDEFAQQALNPNASLLSLVNLDLRSLESNQSFLQNTLQSFAARAEIILASAPGARPREQLVEDVAKIEEGLEQSLENAFKTQNKSLETILGSFQEVSFDKSILDSFEPVSKGLTEAASSMDTASEKIRTALQPLEKGINSVVEVNNSINVTFESSEFSNRISETINSSIGSFVEAELGDFIEEKIRQAFSSSGLNRPTFIPGN